jgi:hypothetical protein
VSPYGTSRPGFALSGSILVNLFLTNLFFFQWEVGYARFRRLIVASLSSHIVVHLLVCHAKLIG